MAYKFASLVNIDIILYPIPFKLKSSLLIKFSHDIISIFRSFPGVEIFHYICFMCCTVDLQSICIYVFK